MLPADEIVIAAEGVCGTPGKGGKIVSPLLLVLHPASCKGAIIPPRVQDVPGQLLQSTRHQNLSLPIDRRPEPAVGLGVFSQLEFPVSSRRFKECMPARIGAGNQVQPPLLVHQNIAVLWHWRQRRALLPLPRPAAPIYDQPQIVTPAQSVHLLAPAHDIGLIVAPTAGPASAPQLIAGPGPNLLDFKFRF